MPLSYPRYLYLSIQCDTDLYHKIVGFGNVHSRGNWLHINVKLFLFLFQFSVNFLIHSLSASTMTEWCESVPSGLQKSLRWNILVIKFVLWVIGEML